MTTATEEATVVEHAKVVPEGDDILNDIGEPDYLAALGTPGVGSWVRWNSPGTTLGGATVPAIVTRVNADGTLSLSAVSVGCVTLIPADGGESVPHSSDREKILGRNSRNGSWDYLPQEIKLREFLLTLCRRMDTMDNKGKEAGQIAKIRRAAKAAADKPPHQLPKDD